MARAAVLLYCSVLLSFTSTTASTRPLIGPYSTANTPNSTVILTVGNAGANNHTQCSLVPCAKYTQAISDVHTDILASNLETKDLLRTLVKHDIPRQTMATIELHGTRRSAVVTLHKHGPPTCWTIVVGCRVWNDEEVPAMPRTSSMDWCFIDRRSRLSLDKGPPICSYP
jgi:hypothetical protein